MPVVLDYLPNLLLIFCRITAFFVTAPLFSMRNVPTAFKIGIGVFVTLITFSAIGTESAVPFDGNYVLAVLKESLVGLVLGFAAYLFFSVVQIAGSFIDLQMGLGIANIVDPITGAQSPIVGNFKFFIAVLLFLSMNGHLHFMAAIMQSYEWVPLRHEWLHVIAEGRISTFLLESFVHVFAISFQMAAPIVAAMFLVDVGLGMLARTAPQFNVFVVGLPVKLILGIIALMLVVPGFVALFEQLFADMFTAMRRLLALMGTS